MSESVSKHDLPCMSCGYNLRGLSPDGACPECGTEISRSSSGDLLKYADPRWLNGLVKGSRLVFYGTTALLCAVIGGVFLAYLLATTAYSWIGLIFEYGLASLTFIALFAMLWGCWLLTAQEPRVYFRETGISARVLSRGALMAAFVGLVCAKTLSAPFDEIAGHLFSVGACLGFVGCLKQLKNIALRIPDPQLARTTSRRSRTLLLLLVTFVILMLLDYLSSMPRSVPAPYARGLKTIYHLCAVVVFVAALIAVSTITRYRSALARIHSDPTRV